MDRRGFMKLAGGVVAGLILPIPQAAGAPLKKLVWKRYSPTIIPISPGSMPHGIFLMLREIQQQIAEQMVISPEMLGDQR